MKIVVEVESSFNGKFGKKTIELADVSSDVYSLIKRAIEYDKDGKGLEGRMTMQEAFMSGWHVEDIAKQAKKACGLTEDDCCFWKIIDPA